MAGHDHATTTTEIVRTPRVRIFAEHKEGEPTASLVIDVGPDRIPLVLTNPEAHALADTLSLCVDLAFVVEACRRLDEELARPEPERDTTVTRALWDAAVVAYGRGFGSGRGFGGTTRRRVPDAALATLAPAEREVHDELLQARNQHVAHRVGEGQRAIVVATLAAPPAERGIENLFPINIDAGGSKKISETRQIASRLLSWLEKEQEGQANRILDVLRSDVDDAYRAAGQP